MLAIFGTIGLFFAVGFFWLSVIERGRWLNAVIASGLSLFVSLLIFWVIIPTSYAGLNGDESVGFDREISNLKTWDHDMETYLSFDYDGETVTLTNDDSEDEGFSILLTDGEPRWQRICDAVPFHIAPYGGNIGCVDRVLIPAGG